MAKHISIFAFILLSIRPAVARSGTATFCTLPEKVCSCTSTLFKGDSVINPADTMMLWDVDTIDYGSLKVGETLSVQYGFLNISKENLETIPIDSIIPTDSVTAEKYFDNYFKNSGEIPSYKERRRWTYLKKDLDEWQNLRNKRTLFLTLKEYEQCFQFAIKMVYGGLSLNGIRGQRTEVQGADDVILGILAEYAVKKCIRRS
jgi:hypothetical protein